MTRPKTQRMVVLVRRPLRERVAFFEGRILTLDDRIAWLREELRRSIRERATARRLAAAAKRKVGDAT